MVPQAGADAARVGVPAVEQHLTRARVRGRARVRARARARFRVRVRARVRVKVRVWVRVRVAAGVRVPAVEQHRDVVVPVEEDHGRLAQGEPQCVHQLEDLVKGTGRGRGRE